MTTSTPASTLIVNARLVNEGREFDGDLRIAGDRIEAIGSGLLCSGCLRRGLRRRLLGGLGGPSCRFLHCHERYVP